MAKLAEIARKAITTQLGPEEQIRAVGAFETNSSFWAGMISPILAISRQKNFFVGVTNKRLIFIPINTSNRPIYKDDFSIPLTGIEYKSMVLTVKLPGNPKPQKLLPNFRFKGITGFDENEFKAALKVEPEPIGKTAAQKETLDIKKG